jgi:hypothetical protein
MRYVYEILFGERSGSRLLTATKGDIKIILKIFLETCFEYYKVKKDEGYEACIGAKISAIKILVGKPEGNIRGWEDNFKMSLR